MQSVLISYFKSFSGVVLGGMQHKRRSSHLLFTATASWLVESSHEKQDAPLVLPAWPLSINWGRENRLTPSSVRQKRTFLCTDTASCKIWLPRRFDARVFHIREPAGFPASNDPFKTVKDPSLRPAFSVKNRDHIPKGTIKINLDALKGALFYARIYI